MRGIGHHPLHWRIGFAVGNERIIAALARVKSYLDYGAFTPVQVAATAALNGPDDCIREMRAIYKRRRDVLVESFGRAYATAEDAVRKALAAVGRDKVILGKPQVIRIEKN